MRKLLFRMLFSFAILSIFACSDDDDSSSNPSAQNPDGGGNNMANDTAFISSSGTTDLDIGALEFDTCLGNRMFYFYTSTLDSTRIWDLEIAFDTIANRICNVRLPGDYDVKLFTGQPPIPGQDSIVVFLFKIPNSGVGIISEGYVPFGNNIVTVEDINGRTSISASNMQLAAFTSPDTVFLSFRVFE